MRSMCLTLLVLAIAGTSAWGDSLFNSAAAKGGTPVSLRKAKYAVGDIITVIVRESVDATTQSDTDTKKESDVSATASVISNAFLTTGRPAGPLGIKPGWMPNWKVEAQNEHKVAGKTKRKSNLTMTVSCIVTKVYANGNLELKGEKQVSVNREDSRLMIRGIVRGQDVTTENTILSSQIANATIALRGRGPLWNNQRRGLFTKLLDWFSPF